MFWLYLENLKFFVAAFKFCLGEMILEIGVTGFFIYLTNYFKETPTEN